MKQIIILYVVCIFLSACASIQSPTGGPRDETPPILLQASPPNEQTNFAETSITLAFNEYFQLKDAFNQIVISPPMQEQPEFTIRGKKLIIKLKEELLPERTYTIRFGDAIEDITEKNTLTNFQYVFSTGDLIDSLTTSGKLIDAKTGEVEEGVLIMLYPADSMTDSTVYKERPYYFAKTDEAGKFSIGNIKEGRYSAFALKDQNFNYLYDLPNEKIGFLDSTIYIDTIAPTLSFNLFEEANESSFQKLRSAKAVRYGQIQFAFANEVQQGNVTVTNAPGRWTFTDNKDTAFFWFADLTLDSIIYKLQFNDIDTIRSVATRQLADSLMAKKSLKITSNIDAVQPKKGASKLDDNPIETFDLGQQIELTLTSPADEIDSNRIGLFIDSISAREMAIQMKLDSTKLVVKVNSEWENNSYYELKIAEGFASDIYGLTNQSKVYRFKTKSAEDYGTLKIRALADSSSQHILILSNQAGEEIEKFIVSGANNFLEIDYLKPGNYFLTAIIDNDRNGIWTSGDYKSKRQPEKSIKYQEAISIRPNWELDIDWELY